VRLSDLKENIDYRFSPGGVTRMVLPLLKHLKQKGKIVRAHWISLNQSGPTTVQVDGIILHSVSLEKTRLRSYGAVKETIWRTAHGIQKDRSTADDMFWSDEYPEFAHYNRLTAELIRQLDRKYDFDLFYAHDFQQLPMGHMIGTLKPKIYRWHIPFEKSMIPAQWKDPVSTYFNSYDLIVVSTSKYLDSLRRFGYTGRVRKIYPYVDPRDYSHPPWKEVSAVSAKWGIDDNDEVALLVARMDPLKGHDRAVKALASISSQHPNLKLVFVGNGSFSGSRQGLGLSKSAMWREQLTNLSNRLGVQRRVIFTGHLSQRELDAIYERSNFTLLPSIKEGFGLVVVESWLHRKPTLVTDRAGIVEIVEDEKNGLLIDPDDTKGLGETMSRVLDDMEFAEKLAREGLQTSRLCTIDEGLRAETDMISRLVGE
jgi:glycosyltransferase involved in cell wall biosynthesis